MKIRQPTFYNNTLVQNFEVSYMTDSSVCQNERIGDGMEIASGKRIKLYSVSKFKRMIF